MEGVLGAMLLVLLAFTGVVLSEPSISISVDRDITTALEAGGNLKITCHAMEVAGIGALVELYEDIPQKREKVATLQQVEDYYTKRKAAGGVNRYTSMYTYDADAQTGTMVVDIAGIQAEDSGKFLCMYKKGDQEISSETITIKITTPVISVSMGYVHTNGTIERLDLSNPNTSVMFSHGVSDGAACIVRIASYVIVPADNLTVNGMPFGNVSLVRSGGVPKDVQGQPDVYEYINKYMTSSPSYNLDESIVRCVAYAEGFENEVKSAEVTGSATYLPVINCNNLRPKAMDSGRASITCMVFSKPPIISVKVNFGMTFIDNEKEIMFGENQVFKEKYSFSREGTEYNSTVSFNVDGMTDALFKMYKYKFTATNSLGSSLQEFGFEKTEYVSGVSACGSSTSVITLLFLSVWILVKML